MLRALLRWGVGVGLLACGLALFAYGFALDPLWPAQDMTEKLQAGHVQRLAASGEVYRWAGLATLSGLAWLIWCVWRRR